MVNRLTPGPIDPGSVGKGGGYMVDSKTPFLVLHRHFSHAFHIYPLHLVTYDYAGNRSLIQKTLDNWVSLTCRDHPWHCPNGYTFTGAASMSALMGRTEAAVGNLTAFVTSDECHDSTMYSEGSNPVMESPLAAAASTTELLLTSWGGVIRVFPGVPPSW